MGNLDRSLCLVVALALAAASPVLAQEPVEPQAPEPAESAEPAQAAPAEPRPVPAMTDKARIALCKKKRNKPLEARDAAPSRVEGNVMPPRIIHRATPQFRQDGAHGTIILEAVLDEDGCVRQTRILQGLDPRQDDAALAAVRQWVFHPATINGVPVRVYYSLTVNYDRQ